MMHIGPWASCTRKVGPLQLACPSHWYALPIELRTEIWRAWRTPGSYDRTRHSRAIAAALAWYREHSS